MFSFAIENASRCLEDVFYWHNGCFQVAVMRVIAVMWAVWAAGASLAAASLERVVTGRPFFSYEQNVGQGDSAVLYFVRDFGVPVTLTADSLNIEGKYFNFGGGSLRFAAAGTHPEVRSIERWPGILNRFEGPPEKWLRGIPAHRQIQYSNVYPNVDLVFGPGAAGPALTVIVKPGGSAGSVVLDCAPSVSLSTTEAIADLNIGMYGTITLKHPDAWQESGGVRTKVAARFITQDGHKRQIEVAGYDNTKPLYIETQVILTEAGSPIPADSRIAVDDAANIYLAGAVRSDATCGALATYRKQFCRDAFVASVSADGQPVFMSVLAGDVDDSFAGGLALAADSTIVAAGESVSKNFPVTADALQATNTGDNAAVVARVDRRNGNLLYSSFFGAAGLLTVSPDGSVTSLQTLAEGTKVMRLDSTLKRLVYSTALAMPPGGLVSIAVHSDGSVYIASTVYATGGNTPELPTTPGALQTQPAGLADAYIVRLAPDGSHPIFATFFGAKNEQNSAIAIVPDPSGDAWVYLSTFGSAAAPLDRNGSTLANSLIRISADGTRLVSKQVFAGPGFGLFAVKSDRIFIAGPVDSKTPQITSDASVTAPCGQSPAYVTIRNVDGSLRFGSYLPSQTPYAIYAVSPAGQLYIATTDVKRLDADKPAKLFASCAVSAASRLSPDGISPGEIVSVVGAKLGPEEGVAGKPDASGSFPTTLNGVRVVMNGTPTPLLYAGPSQINAIVPYSVPAPAIIDVTVDDNGQQSTFSVDVVPAGFSMFTVDMSGTGQAAALNQDGTVNSPSNPAARGSVVMLFGTGGGSTNPDSVAGTLAPLDPALVPRLALPVKAYVGQFFNQVAEVLYAGAAPGLVNGLSQINIRIPDAVTPGASVPVEIVIGNTTPGKGATFAVK